MSELDISDFSVSESDEYINNHSKKNESWRFTSYQTFGNLYILLEWLSNSKSIRVFIIGPDWVYYLLFLFVLGSFWLFVNRICSSFYVLKLIYSLVTILILFSSLCSFLYDPGVLRRYHHARSKFWTYCDQCSAFRPPKCVHCSICNVCIADYDHHCPVSILDFRM